MAVDTYTIEVIPFSQYNWTFEHPGWLNLNPAAVALITTFLTLGYYLSLELFLLTLLTFRNRKTLYFYSLLVSTAGLVLQSTGYVLKAFENPAPPVFVTILCKVGWVSNVTGFSLVLWSRLHLITTNRTLLKLTLCAIILNAILLHTPIIVFEFGLLSPEPQRQVWLFPMEIMERIQQTVFTLQETFLGGVYIFFTFQFLRSGGKGGGGKVVRRVVGLLIAVQLLAIGLDAGLTAFDFLNMFTLKCTLHPFVYAVKLRLEFVVLNQLVGVVKGGLLVKGEGVFTGEEEQGWIGGAGRGSVVSTGIGKRGGVEVFNVPLSMKNSSGSDESIDFLTRAAVAGMNVPKSGAGTHGGTDSASEIDSR
ncbi:hypothetical protein QBC41DRAFT_344455 [Cercophora samala]|uniref:DUF7703 domain-containing protein n=1 Tax=Cercophora samala TaxID=330535 RepID=A0AA39ZIG3_9PEZI|nr:hypothetical protein QBC41DRAFT_344455 [Cercophora samala]